MVFFPSRKLLLFFVSFASIAATSSFDILRSQDAPKPAKELEKFAPFLGNWKGSGTFRLTEDGQSEPWEGSGTVRKILDGFAILEDMRVDMGEGVPPLLFRSVYGWDSATRTYRWFTLSNLGFGGTGEARFTSDGKLLVSSEDTDASDRPVLDQTLTWMEGGKYRFLMRRSIAGDEFFVHVQGSYEKSDEALDFGSGTEDLAVAPPTERLKKIAAQVGMWRFEGKVSPMPGAPTFAVRGKENIRRILGGHAFYGESTGEAAEGDAMRYRGIFHTVWDDATLCYRTLGVDNFGNFEDSRGYLVGDRQLVQTAQSYAYGMPVVSRTVLTWNESGDKLEIKADRCGAAAPCDTAFEATYHRVAGARDERSPEDRSEK